jgi:hypothetical protein
MRYRHSLFASLLIALALALATSASAQDADGDGTADDVDNCINAPNGPTLRDLGQNIQRDTNGDGFGNVCDADLNDDGIVDFLDLGAFSSVFFSADADADLNGDGVVDFLDLGRLSALFFLAPGPTCCEGGFPPIPFEGVSCVDTLPTSECTITVNGVSFVTTRAKISLLEPSAGASQGLFAASAAAGAPPGIAVSDDLRIPTPLGDIVLAEASLEITVAEGAELGPFTPLERLVGIAKVPFPNIGFMSGVQIDEEPMATVRLDVGANLEALVGIPLVDDHQYLLYQFSSSFGASLGPISFSIGGPAASMVLDPSDLFWYVGGSLGGLFPEGDSGGGGQPPAGGDEGGTSPEEFGFGVSLTGSIPFVPETTFGLGDELGIFFGHLLVKAKVPFPPLPLALDGIAIANIDPDQNGTIFVLSPDLQLGGNGLLRLEIPFLKFFSFGLDLGTSSTGVELSENDVAAFFSGVLAPDDPFAMFPPDFPIPIRQNPSQVGAQVAGAFSAANPATSFVRAKGQFSIDLGPLGEPIGVNLGTMGSTDVELSLNPRGLFFSGTTQSQIVPDLTNSEMSLSVSIPADALEESFAELQGALTVAGLGLEPARIFISPLGFEVEGRVDLQPVALLEVTGGIGASGLMLEGNFDSNINFNLQATIDDILFEAQLAVDIAQDALGEVQVVLDGCKDLCPGGCYLNPCCAACEVTFGAPLLAAELVLAAAELALDGVEAAVGVFFDALPFPIAGTIAAHVDVSIDNLAASGHVSASFFGLNLAGSANFIPPQVCITLPLGAFPGASELGLGDTEFCLPPY